ncbi:DNA translocase FtsK 4TM domain-containing protein [Leptospira sp. 96542]|nr:DNA translocase FtsK 4TM domain-containing protein [Leptospira sp. 96542]
MEPKKSVQGLLLQRRDFFPYLFIFAAVFLSFSLFSFQEGEDGSLANWFGRLGHYISFTFLYLLGKVAFLVAGFFLVLGVLSLKDPSFDSLGKTLFFPLFVIASAVSLQLLETPAGNLGDGGGVIGQFFSWLLSYLFGETGRVIVVFFMFLYFAVVWLEDSAWSFTFHRFHSFSNQVYKMFGGKNDLAPFVLPEFLSKIAVDRFPKRDQSSAKQWFEVKKENEGFHFSPDHASFWEEIESDLDPGIEGNEAAHKQGETQIKSKPHVRFQNTQFYLGYFDESRKVFRFDSERESFSQSLGFQENKIPPVKILDLRTKLETPETESTFQFPKFTLDEKSVTDFGLGSLSLPIPKRDWDANDDEEMNGDLSGDGRRELVSPQSWDEDMMEEDSEISESDSNFHENVSSESESISISKPLEWEEGDASDEFGDDEGEPSKLSGIGSLDTRDQSEPEETLEEVVFTEDELTKKRLAQNAKREIFPSKKQSLEPELMFGSTVPKLKLKRSKYYISPRLLAKHETSPINLAKFDSELDLVSHKIEEGIGHFGIESKVISRERGPIITRYEITIPNGIKLNRIVSLSDEIRAYLEVKNIRIVAPIPGKSTIGIEVPNRIREDVFLSEILKDSILQNKSKDLSICIGKDISGKIVMIDLAKLPHLLVAGTTGSGKSVSLNAMITSLICTRSPEEVRFIMIDPKMVEMTLYEGIPHLLMPVITDPKKATKALSWAIAEMEARYQMISQLKSRDFKSFNEKVDEFAHAKGFQKLPYIVIFIDELADLMMVSGKDLEEQIQRISQKARAVGIHLVMATQRPSVDVITGVIKANCPARVAFQVAQRTDSRTILDTNGAESLLGKGDFLYRSPTSSDLLRIQAPYIEEKEIETIVEEAKKQGAPSYVEINWEDETNMEMASDEDEELFDEAWNIVVTEKKASASYLQRRMRIGYNKAARLMELMEMRGYVSAQVGAKPREILRSA